MLPSHPPAPVSPTNSRNEGAGAGATAQAVAAEIVAGTRATKPAFGAALGFASPLGFGACSKGLSQRGYGIGMGRSNVARSENTQRNSSTDYSAR